MSTPDPSPTPAPDWHAADKAYQRHHFNCPICCAAGSAPGGGQRCEAGQALWDTYEAAGMPPHVSWLRERTIT